MKAILLWAMLLFCFPVKAQNPATATNSGFKLFFEKTYLHIDRDIYAQGDTLWYKAYLVNGQNNIPAKTSSTLYIDLIDSAAHAIRTEIIHLTDGLGNGDFDLPDNFAPGQYRLRAYTNWMRNFGDNFVFEKEITVLSSDGQVATEAKGVPVDKRVAGKKAAAAAEVKNKNGITASATGTATLPLINFYPEGGSMIENVSSLVAVKAEDGTGKGVVAAGTVVSLSGDTIARFSCDSLGMGLFALLPVKGQVYHAVVIFAGGVPKQVRHDITVDLPAALQQGLSMQVKQTDSLLHIIISRAEKPVTDTGKFNYSVVVKHSGQAIIKQSIQAGTRQTVVNISIAQLPEGIAGITIYDEQDKPNCERLVYIHHTRLWGTTVLTDKKAYRPFEKTTLQVDAGQAASLSVAVVDAGEVPEQADDIVSYLMLRSEIKGNIEHASRYFDTTNINRYKQLDLLLLTQGWRDFVWRRMADAAIRLSYISENGITVSGKVRDEINHKPMPNLNVSLYADGAKGQKIFAARSGADGRFIFPDLALYGIQNIKLSSVNDKGDKKGSFDLDTLSVIPATTVTANSINAIDTTSKTVKALVQKTIAAKTAKGITNLKEIKISAKKDVLKLDNGRNLMTFGLQQEFNITPKDYQYNTLTAFLLQNDKRAVSSDGSKPGIAYIVHGHRFYPPLVVNGSTFHINKELYFDMPMEKYKKVEVHELMEGYIILLTTKEDALTDNPGRLSLDVQGYYEARTFYKPLYDESNPPKTDFRTTLHWEPNLKTDIKGHASLSFYNAGNPTSVRVIVQGITAYGMPIAESIRYTVK